MHTVLATIGDIFSALTRFCMALSEQFFAVASHRLGMFGLATIVVTSLLLALACSTWALVERWRRSNYRSRVQAVLRRAQFARHFRDSILDSLPEMIVVLRSRARNPLSFGGGSALLQECLKGLDATPLAVAINDLLQHGSGFSLSVRTSHLQQIFVRGLRVAGGNALFLRAQDRLSGHVLLRKPSPMTAAVLSAAAPTAPPCDPADAEVAGDTHETAAQCHGEVIIGPDGRLKHYNSAFARLWSLRDDTLCGEPLWADIAAHCVARDGYDAIWDIVSYAATVPEPERLNDWSSSLHGNGKKVSLAVSRLDDGTTRVIFVDNIPLPPSSLTATPKSDTLAA